MEILIAIVIFGLGFAYFATENNLPVVIHLIGYSFNMPLYLLVIIPLLIGLFMSLLFSLIENFSASLTIWGKENRIKADRKQIALLKDRLHEVELENAKLKGEEEGKEHLRKNAVSYT